MDEEPLVGGAKDAEMISEDCIFFGDRKLEAFNGRRLTAANALGMRVFRLTAEQQQTIHNGDASSYDGALFDIQIVIFLCAHGIKKSYECFRKPSAIVEEALEWAEKENIIPGRKQFDNAATAFGELMDSIFKNDANQEVASDEVDLSGPPKKKRSR